MNSIMSNEKRCYVCGSQISLHRHHIYAGRANRKNSEEHGCWCWLCIDHHIGYNGVHNNSKLDIRLKKECQKIFEQEHTREEFRQIFGKSYIWEENDE